MAVTATTRVRPRRLRPPVAGGNTARSQSWYHAVVRAHDRIGAEPHNKRMRGLAPCVLAIACRPAQPATAAPGPPPPATTPTDAPAEPSASTPWLTPVACSAELVAAWRTWAASRATKLSWPDIDGDGSYVRCADVSRDGRSLILVAAFFDAEPLGRSTSLVVTSFEGAEARGEVIIASDLDGGLSSCARNLDYDVHPERIALSQEEIAGVAVVRIAYDTDVCGEASGSYAHERAWVTIAPGGEPSLALHCTVGTESYVVSNEACESYDCDTQEYADLELELDAQGLRACRDPQTCRRFAWRDGTLFDPHSTAACAPP